MHTRIKLVLLVALLAVSTSAILARFLPDVPAVVISFWRIAIASGLLWFYTTISHQKSPERSSLKLYILSGFLLALHFSCFYNAVKLTSIANATLLGVTAPLFTILFERLVLKKPLKPLVFIGFVFAICGTIIIAGSGIVINDGSLLGKIYGLSAALFIALVYILADKLRIKTNTIAYTRLLYTIAAIFLLSFSIIGGNNVLAIHESDVVWLIALGVIPTILGHSIFYYSIKYTSPTIVASIPLGEPIIASILAFIIFFETVPIITLIGGLLILIGVYLIITHSHRSRPSDTL